MIFPLSSCILFRHNKSCQKVHYSFCVVISRECAEDGICVPIKKWGMCTPAFLSKHFSWPQMDFRHHWNPINHSQLMNDMGIKNVGLVSENTGQVVFLEKYIFGLAPSNWMQPSDLRPGCIPVTVPLHHTMLFDLKRVFFIFNFKVISTVPIGKKSVASSYFPGRGSGVGVGLVPCSRALPPNSCLISHGLEFGHERYLQATTLYSYLIIKGYFS